MKKYLLAVTACIVLTGCCTYQRDAKLEKENADKAKIEKEYKKCLASEFISTLKYWVMLGGVL